MSIFRCLFLACLSVALAGCQSAAVRDNQSQLFQRYLAEGQLARADQLLADADARGVDPERRTSAAWPTPTCNWVSRRCRTAT